jgi:chromosome segregation ATPase
MDSTGVSMAEKRKKHEQRHQKADAQRAEPQQSGAKKGKARGAVPSRNRNGNDVVRRMDGQPSTARVPGPVQVMPPSGPFQTGWQSQQTLMTSSQSSTNISTTKGEEERDEKGEEEKGREEGEEDDDDNDDDDEEEDSEGELEDQVQELQQEFVESSKEAQERGKGKQSAQRDQQEGETATGPRLDIQALVTKLDEAKKESAKLEKKIDQKDKKIDQLQNEIENARTKQRRAIDNNKLGEAEEFAKKYAALSALCDKYEEEKKKLEGKLKASRAEVKRLESELEDSQIEVQKLEGQLRKTKADLIDAYNTIKELKGSALVTPTSNEVCTEQNTATEATRTSGGPSDNQSVRDASTQDSVSTTNRATNGGINGKSGRGREKENASNALSVVRSGDGVTGQRKVAQAKRGGLFLFK